MRAHPKVPTAIAGRRSASWSVRLAALAVTGLLECTNGDVVFLQDGREIPGRVVSNNTGGVEIDAVVHGIRARLKFGINEVRRVQMAALPDGFFPPERVTMQTPRVSSGPAQAGKSGAPGACDFDSLAGIESTTEAVQKCRAAAERGSAAAQLELAARYEAGWGLPADFGQAWVWLRRAADGGLPEAQFRLGKALRSQDSPADRAAGTALLAKAATAAHSRARWELVRIYTSGDGLPVDPGIANRWLTRLIEVGERPAHEELARRDPGAYRRLAVPLDSATGGSNDLGPPVRVHGELLAMDKSTWTVRTGNRTVQVASLRLRDDKARAGRWITLYGALDPGGRLDAMLVTIPEPAYRFQSRLEEHAVLGGTEQAWTVRLSVRNTGEQRIENLQLLVRCYQVQSPNDFTQEVTVRDLAPGEVKECTAEFSFYNFRYIGASSTPRVDVVPGKLGW